MSRLSRGSETVVWRLYSLLWPTRSRHSSTLVPVAPCHIIHAGQDGGDTDEMFLPVKT